MAYKNVNLNPAGRRTEDCAVRALAAAMSKPGKRFIQIYVYRKFALRYAMCQSRMENVPDWQRMGETSNLQSIGNAMHG